MLHEHIENWRTIQTMTTPDESVFLEISSDFFHLKVVNLESLKRDGRTTVYAIYLAVVVGQCGGHVSEVSVFFVLGYEMSAR